MGMNSNWSISEDTVRHIWERHRDLVEALGGKSPEELIDIITEALRRPDEIFVDRFRNDVKYHLKRVDDRWINVVLVGNTVKTAYLLSLKSYKRFREKRWRQRS